MRNVAAWRSVLGVIAVGLTVACSGGGSGNADGGDGGDGGSVGSGVPRSTKLTDLTPDQAKAVCDYSNNIQGGYGRTQTCDDGNTNDTHSSQEFCITQLPGLGSVCNELTVGDIEDCARDSGTNLCALTTAPGCAAERTCYGIK